jgi:hypothetical protein
VLVPSSVTVTIPFVIVTLTPLFRVTTARLAHALLIRIAAHSRACSTTDRRTQDSAVSSTYILTYRRTGCAAYGTAQDSTTIDSVSVNTHRK